MLLVACRFCDKNIQLVPELVNGKKKWGGLRMLTEQTIKKLVKEAATEVHIKFLQHYLNNKNIKTFLSPERAYKMVRPEMSGASARAGGCRLQKLYSKEIANFIVYLNHSI